MSKILCADLFCGGGGTSTGMINAFHRAGVNDYQLIGVNHWNIAIETNKINHPFEKLYCSTVQNVKPREAVPSGRLHFLWASPECTNHSRAKGGRPKDEQSRATAWDILKWAQELYIDRIYIENVIEFLEWGPIDSKGRPMASKKGETFRAFVAALESLGYHVDWQAMNAADFGAPTSRVRLIIQAVRGRGKIVWPEPTHAKEPGMFGEKPWRSAREIIDWSIPGKSIFERKKPLAEKTIRRIESGIRKYWGEWAEPFLVILRGTKGSQCRASARKLDEPLPTVSAGGVHAGIVEPFLVRYNGGDDRHHSINEPVPVLDCSNRYGMVEPFIFATGHTSGKGRTTSIHDPISTVVTKAEHCIVEPLIVDMSHPSENGNARVTSGGEPIKTITTRNNMALVEPLFIPQQSAGTVKPVSNPLPTVAAAGAISIVEPFILSQKFSNAPVDCRKPLPTITTVNSFSIVEPFMVKFYGNEHGAESLNDPIGTICTKDRFGLVRGYLVEVNGARYVLDIRFRMLQPHELAKGMGFPADYKFAGKKKDQVKQIGNAVSPNLSEALIYSALCA